MLLEAFKIIVEPTLEAIQSEWLFQTRTNHTYHQARRQDLVAGGPKREMGGYRFQMGGPGTTGPPLATTLHITLESS